MPESIYPLGRSKQYLIGEVEKAGAFPGNSIRSWRIEAPSFSAMPQWLDALLHQQENHHEVILYRAGAKYNLDLRRLPEDNRRFFLTLYDNPTRTSLIQGEFEIRGGALFLPHLSDRGKNNVKNLFKGQEFLTNLGGREPNFHPFDRFGRIWGEEKPENNKLTKASEKLRTTLAFVIGQIAAAEGVTEMQQETSSFEHPYLNWHPYYLKAIADSIRSGPRNGIACLATTSEQKLRLANGQPDVLFLDALDPNVAEAGPNGMIEPFDVQKLFGESEFITQNIYQTVRERERNTYLNAERKAAALVAMQEDEAPVYATDTAPAIIVTSDYSVDTSTGIDQITNETGVRILAQGFEDVDTFRGARIIIHNAQAVAYSMNENIQAPFMMLKNGQWTADVGEKIQGLIDDGSIRVISKTKTVVLQFHDSIPLELLERAKNSRSGLGIDLYPDGILNEKLAPYISAWVRNGSVWVRRNLYDEEIRASILGFSQTLFNDIVSGQEVDGIPTVISKSIVKGIKHLLRLEHG